MLRVVSTLILWWLLHNIWATYSISSLSIHLIMIYMVNSAWTNGPGHNIFMWLSNPIFMHYGTHNFYLHIFLVSLFIFEVDWLYFPFSLHNLICLVRRVTSTRFLLLCASTKAFRDETTWALIKSYPFWRSSFFIKHFRLYP